MTDATGIPFMVMPRKYESLTKLTEAWLNETPGPCRSYDGSVIRHELVLYLRNFGGAYAHMEPRFVVRKIPGAAINLPGNITPILLNSDVFDTGRSDRTERASHIVDIIRNKYASKFQVIPLPGSLLDEASIPVWNYGYKNFRFIINPPARDIVVIAKSGKSVLFGIDESGWFASLLPKSDKQVKNVNEAYQSLKPREVIDAEKTDTEIKRQGDWFLIKENRKEILGLAKTKLMAENIYKPCHPDDPESVKRVPTNIRGFALPCEINSNIHFGTKGFEYKKNIFVTGTVRHYRSQASVWNDHQFEYNALEHRMLRLGTDIYMAVKNRSRKNYKSGNRRTSE